MLPHESREATPAPQTFAEGLKQIADRVARCRAAGIDPFAGEPRPLDARRAKLKARRVEVARRKAEKLTNRRVDHALLDIVSFAREAAGFSPKE